MFKSTEIVNQDLCLKLNQLTFGQFNKELFEGIDFDCVDKNGCEEEIQFQFDLLKKFTKEMIISNYECKRVYRYSQGSNCGRMFVEGQGIQRLHHKIRGVLCDGLYNDFDMVNAHPSILLYLCKKLNFPCYNLQSYVINRDECISNLMNDINGDRASAKKMFLQSMNSEKITKKYYDRSTKRWLNIKDPFFLKMDEEFKQLQKLFLTTYDEFRKELIKRGITENIQGKVLNKVLCINENKILHEGIDKLQEQKLIDDKSKMVLMFDGFMVQSKEHYELEKIIESLNDNEYDIKWDIKEHNLSLLDNLNCINVDNNKNIVSGHFEQLSEIAKYLNETVLKDKLIFSNGMLYYSDNNVLRTDEKIIKNIICRLIKDSDLWNKCMGEYIHVSFSINWVTDIYKWIIFDVLENNKFLDDVWDNTLHKVCFKNGYYDFRKQKFIKEYKDLTTPIVIERDLNLKSNEKVRRKIFKKVLYPIFDVKEVGDDNHKLMEYFLHKFARVISGHIEDKNWFKFEGLRDSGKGVFSDLMKNSFGKYIQYTNASNFVTKSGDEDAKSLSWILDFQFSRLAITQEIKLDKNTSIDGNKIKKFCSGGDYFSARKNFKDEVEFKVQSAVLICCNDFPEIKPSDALQKCISFNMPSKFVQNIEDDKEYSNYSYYEADGTIKEYIKKEKVVNEFVLIMLDYYKRNDTSYPKSILEKSCDLEEEEDEKIMINLFKINSSVANEFITNKELGSVLKDNNINITVKKAKTLLVGKGAKVHRTGKGRGLLGIQIIEEDEDE